MKAIVFDLGDTLVEYEGLPLSWEAHYPDAIRAFAAHLGARCSPQQLHDACDILRRYNTRLHPRTHEVAFSVIASELAACLGVLAPVDEGPAARAFFHVFRQRLRCFADTPAALASLRARGFKLGVFTDVPYGMPRELVLEDLQLTGLANAFDLLLTSRDVGFRKPAGETLLAVGKALGCSVAEMVYVGNERKDIEAARACGCTAILLARQPAAADWGQHRTIASLAEL